jgi:hypothetical protein
MMDNMTPELALTRSRYGSRDYGSVTIYILLALRPYLRLPQKFLGGGAEYWLRRLVSAVSQCLGAL